MNVRTPAFINEEQGTRSALMDARVLDKHLRLESDLSRVKTNDYVERTHTGPVTPVLRVRATTYIGANDAITQGNRTRAQRYEHGAKQKPNTYTLVNGHFARDGVLTMDGGKRQRNTDNERRSRKEHNYQNRSTKGCTPAV